MVESLYEGFLIGLFTSAPVGPIALLCIQRTLQKGRWHGFYSGLGAATSDFLYALIAMLGLSFVMNFIQQNEFLIQVIGSTVVMLFGVYIFFQNPASGLKKNEEGKTSYSQEYVTSFLLTLSNP
ncbi:MAG TPA: LysE family transporter, partial [Candidatus Enterocola sp.]|nr:LysE family transporter [Candidatus Enterocola sp.]